MAADLSFPITSGHFGSCHGLPSPENPNEEGDTEKVNILIMHKAKMGGQKSRAVPTWQSLQAGDKPWQSAETSTETLTY